jgi:hypothetical protein
MQPVVKKLRDASHADALSIALAFQQECIGPAARSPIICASTMVAISYSRNGNLARRAGALCAQVRRNYPC